MAYLVGSENITLPMIFNVLEMGLKLQRLGETTTTVTKSWLQDLFPQGPGCLDQAFLVCLFALK